jgi:hypothetical protein
MLLKLLKIDSPTNVASNLPGLVSQNGTRAIVGAAAWFHGSAVMPRRRCLLRGASLAGLFTAMQARALTIHPTFDPTIANDPNAAAIEGTLNGVISTYEPVFSDPISVSIDFQEMNTGLGDSSTGFYTITYLSFINALHADAKTGNDQAALGLLPVTAINPVTGSSAINVKTADLKALGFNPVFFPPIGGFDGEAGLNTHITDIGSPGTSGAFSLRTVAEHEIDEVLGLGSDLPSGGDPFPEDLYRYDSSGQRSFTASSSATAFFSINGTNDLAQFDNQNDCGDFGDWQSNPHPNGVGAQIQDAFATPGANLPPGPVELAALDVIGYDLQVPEPASIGLLGSALAALGCLRRRRAPIVNRA